MKLTTCKKVLKFSVEIKLKTNLLIKSGEAGDYTDSTIERTPEGMLHINGYVWGSLLRRAISRIKGGEGIAALIGKNNGDDGVSPLWCEPSFVKLPLTDIKTGIKINRKWGTTDIGALYSDEIVPPGIILKLNFNYFCDDSTIDDIKDKIASAFWVINEGIENIGSGWSYGYGRLEVLKIRYKTIDLSDEGERGFLWGFEGQGGYKETEQKKTEISKQWIKYNVRAEIADGQLLAIHTVLPLSEIIDRYPELPDTFVFRRYKIKNDKPELEIVITGKAIRQTLLSAQIERKLRSLGEDICDDTTKKKDCTCKRCLWFGNTNSSGIIAVLDANVNNPNTEVLHRIQLCEHSMQNINLFSGEYLTKGDFDIEIIIDCSRVDSENESLIENVKWVLEELKGENNAPPGWYRMGATSTCTGQVEVIKVGIDERK